MKNLATKISFKNNQLLLICLVLFAALIPNILHSQQYRFIDAYMNDFQKNEMFIKKSLMDYSITIVESQLDSRSKVAAKRIIEKLEKMNSILINTNKGFENDTFLRDSFIKMNKKTIASLTNGSLILNDYEYQSSFSLAVIDENMNRKEREVISYYQELKNYEKNKIDFACRYNIEIKKSIGKNILEYNAYQNFIFYKVNVIDQKLMTLIKAKDQKGFYECFNTIETMHLEAITKTNQYRCAYKDNSMNDANVKYSNFINDQREKLTLLFNNFADDYIALQLLKNSATLETTASIAAYNVVVRTYNAKKNLFYAAFDSIQLSKKALYNSWFVTNSAFLKNNGEFKDIHQSFVVN